MEKTSNCNNIAQGVENTPLISQNSTRPSIKIFICTRNHFLPRSKATTLILLWHFIATLYFGAALNPDLYLIYLNLFGFDSVYICLVYTVIAMLFIFYPLSGFLADVRFGRYKTVVRSIWLFFSGALIVIVTITILIICITPGSIVYIVIGGGFLVIAMILLPTGFIGLYANIIQFGVDQLHDTPVGDTSLFIHWYVLLFNLGALIAQFLVWSSILSAFWIFCVTLEVIFVIFILPISLCLGNRRRNWFLIEPGQRNPYKLVYKVVKFAIKHKHPVDRSAFTYCEDEFPSRMDLGKDKYGGPFSTEQVEDVKAFFGILLVLITLGPTFAIEIHSSAYIEMVGSRHYFEAGNDLLSIFNKDTLSSILAVAFVSAYIFLLRPFISHRIPSMLKRIGLGMIVHLISLLLIFSVNTAELIAHNGHICVSSNLSHFANITFESPSISTTMLVLTHASSALANVLLYIASFEFICAQAPYSMKGFLIGLFFAIKGVFQLIGIGIGAPFVFLNGDLIKPFNDMSYAVCGFGYYLVLIIIALVSLAMFILVAKRYKFRQRDEPSNLHRYAEEYYANIQHERHYDYDADGIITYNS